MAPSLDAPRDAFLAGYAQPGTRLYEDSRRQTRFLTDIEALPHLPPLLDGAFGTNVLFGRFEVEGVLGHGAQGTTLSGIDNKTGAQVCIKLFDFRHAADWKAVELFEREVDTLGTLEHARMPMLVAVHDDPETHVRALVMTRVPGETFARFADDEGPLGEAQVWRLLDDAAEVLGVLHHRAGVVHRDIKPENLVRMPDGRCGLIDFGGVSAAKKAAGSTVVGTLGYMAPEQLYGDAHFATDIYALGATALHLITGVEPEHLPRKGLRFDIAKAAPQLSAPLLEVLTKMTAPEPEARPKDAATLRAELDAAASSTGEKKREKRKKAKKGNGEWRAPRRDGPADTSPKTDARFEQALVKRKNQNEVASAARIGVGIVGTIAVVAVFDVFFSLVLTLLGAFSSGKSKSTVQRVQNDLAGFAARQKRELARSIDRGANGLKSIEHQARKARALRTDQTRGGKRQRRAEREARRRDKRHKKGRGPERRR